MHGRCSPSYEFIVWNAENPKQVKSLRPSWGCLFNLDKIINECFIYVFTLRIVFNL